MYSGYGENVRGMIPSKLFDYIACGKPILALLPECKAKRIIEDHHGGIWVESDGPGKGSTFFVELPAS